MARGRIQWTSSTERVDQPYMRLAQIITRMLLHYVLANNVVQLDAVDRAEHERAID